MVVACRRRLGAAPNVILLNLEKSCKSCSYLAKSCKSCSYGLLAGYRNARACPSRSFDGPEHGGGQAPALRWRGNFFYTVARGPVPRDRSMARKHLLRRSARACPSRASDGPRHGGGQAPALRWRGDIFYSVARGPVPLPRATPHHSQPVVHEVLGESPPRSPSVPLVSRRAARQRRLLHQPHLRQR